MSTAVTSNALVGPESQTGPSAVSIIRPKSGWQFLDVGELWRYRELLFFFVWRDIKVRYKQTVMGAAWAVIQPLIMMVVLTFVMGRLANVSTGAYPKPIFYFSGVLLWNFFATAINTAANSVVQSNLQVTKVYFPRLTIPFASIGAAAIDFCIAFVFLILMLIYYGIDLTAGIVMVPALLLLTSLAALGVGTFLAALNVAYRDFRYTLPFLVQIWMFATPSIYLHMEQPTAEAATTAVAGEGDNGSKAASDQQGPKHTSPPQWLNLNPMTPLIASFRASILGGAIPWSNLAYATVSIVFVFAAGCLYFKRLEGSFADII